MNRYTVKNILKSWLDGSLDSHEWDDFISVKNKHSQLESIRERAQEIWVKDSVFLEPASINPCSLSDLGRTEVTKMLKLVEELEADV